MKYIVDERDIYVSSYCSHDGLNVGQDYYMRDYPTWELITCECCVYWDEIKGHMWCKLYGHQTDENDYCSDAKERDVHSNS